MLVWKFTILKAPFSSHEEAIKSESMQKIDQNRQFVARLKKSKSLFFCIVVDLSKSTNAM